MAKKYIAKIQLVHRENGQTYEIGQPIPLDHLTEDEVKILVDRKYVVETESDIQVSELESIKGITPKIAEALAEQNVRTYADLVRMNPDDITAAVEGTNFKQVRKWQADALVANAPK